MKVISALLCFTMCVSDLSAYTRAEQNAVACYLIDRVRRGVDVIDSLGLESDREIHVQFPTYESLFVDTLPEGVPGHGWTADEKRAAFEAFLMDIPRLAATNEVEELALRGEVGLCFCDERGGTFAYVAATNLLVSSCMTCEGVAMDIFKNNYQPSREMNSFIEMVITNRPTSARVEYLQSFYAGDIARSYCDQKRELAIDAAKMLMHNRCGGSASRQLDRMLSLACPEYAISSNRLDLAEWTLRDLELNPRLYGDSVRQYFESVTNQLMSATQPLIEVEALRGL